jgi:hypothetical protein
MRSSQAVLHLMEMSGEQPQGLFIVRQRNRSLRYSPSWTMRGLTRTGSIVDQRPTRFRCDWSMPLTLPIDT